MLEIGEIGKYRRSETKKKKSKGRETSLRMEGKKHYR